MRINEDKLVNAISSMMHKYSISEQPTFIQNDQYLRDRIVQSQVQVITINNDTAAMKNNTYGALMKNNSYSALMKNENELLKMNSSFLNPLMETA